MSDDVAHMRALAQRGGNVTKQRMGADFFREIGAMGGKASKGKKKHPRVVKTASKPKAAPPVPQGKVVIPSAAATIDAILEDLEDTSW